MFKMIFGICFLVLSTTLTSVSWEPKEDQILGAWQDAEHPEKKIEFQKQNNTYTGRSLEEQEEVVFRNLVYDVKDDTYEGELICNSHNLI